VFHRGQKYDIMILYFDKYSIFILGDYMVTSLIKKDYAVTTSHISIKSLLANVSLIKVGSRYKVHFIICDSNVDSYFELLIYDKHKIGMINELYNWLVKNSNNKIILKLKIEFIEELDVNDYNDNDNDINLSFKNDQVLKGAYCLYYQKYKLLVEEHKKLKFGKGTGLAVNFSEGVCRYLYSLNKNNQKTYDADDDYGFKYEIKSTIYEAGNVTINKKVEFD
jgi:hypothetical protein